MRSISRYTLCSLFFCSVPQLFIQQLRETGSGESCGDGSGVHFRLRVSNLASFPLLSSLACPRSLSLPPCKHRAKDTETSSRSPPPRGFLSTQAPVFSFQVFPLFFTPCQPLVFFAASTNLRRILVSAFLAVFPFCMQPAPRRCNPPLSLSIYIPPSPPLSPPDRLHLHPRPYSSTRFARAFLA